MGLKISKSDYQAFLEYYTWKLLSNPDYRLGEAFLTFFPDVYSEYRHYPLAGLILFWNNSNEAAQRMIDVWLD